MKRLERKVKIVCTMGPACWDEETISELVRSGMNVARLNFSHGDHDSHTKTINNVRKVEETLRRPVATLLDTKGPEIRTGMLEGHQKVMLEAGNGFSLLLAPAVGNSVGVYVDYHAGADLPVQQRDENHDAPGPGNPLTSRFPLPLVSTG